ncbi:hypothetical protein IKW72_00710 [bacterium]|nr:hypothetical protein [bacterium]
MKGKLLLFGAVFLLLAAGCATVFHAEDELPLREMIAQKLCVDLRYWELEPGTIDPAQTEPVTYTVKVLNDEIAEALNELRPGSVILFAESCQEGKAVRKLTDDIRSLADSNSWPRPLLTVDEEGGRVERLTFGPHFPSAAALGRMNAEYITNIASEIADLTLSAGFDLDFAPVCDIDSNPKNPVINTRSFGHDAATVTKGAAAFIKAFKQQGLLSCAKHFPGHGDTATDSHTGLPKVEKNLDDLRQLELIPFKAAIDEGVDCVMTTHIQFPNIEKETLTDLNGKKILRPATLSKKILKGVLREELGFEGVIISDDLDMDAISKNFDWKEAVIEAWIAGVDIAIVTKRFQSKNSINDWNDLIDKTIEAVKNGRYPIEELKRSCERIAKLKAQDRAYPDKSRIAYYESLEAFQKIDELAVSTLEMKGDTNLLAKIKAYRGPWFKQTFQDAARRRHFFLFNDTPFINEDNTITLLYNYSPTVPQPDAVDAFQKMFSAAKSRGRKVIFLSCGFPHAEQFAPDADLTIISRGGLSGLASVFGDLSLKDIAPSVAKPPAQK